MTTIGLDFRTTKVQLDEHRAITMQLWDTAGQERFLSITRAYIRGATGIVLVYDITKQSSFTNCQTWLQTIQDFADEGVLIFLVGNKTDLAHDRQVSYDSGKALAEQNGLDFFEVSAKDGTNVRELFQKAARKLAARNLPNTETKPEVQLGEVETKGCSC
ncbi:hypothetical protein RCL1_006725 [Eukaryota sp. TZLM3-RCL]